MRLHELQNALVVPPSIKHHLAGKELMLKMFQFRLV